MQNVQFVSVDKIYVIIVCCEGIYGRRYCIQRS